MIDNFTVPGTFFTLPAGVAAEEFVLQAWETRVENILQTNITRVAYVISHRGMEYQTFSSENISLIERWKALLPRLQVSVIPAEAFVGGGSALKFYGGDMQLQLLTGHPAPDIFFIKEGRIGEDWWRAGKMLRIDNFDEVGEEFMAILREMGVTRWDPVEADPEE